MSRPLTSSPRTKSTRWKRQRTACKPCAWPPRRHIIDQKRYAELNIPPAAIPLIEWAWETEPPALYGRFDIAWAGAQSGHPPKLLEYNADTPTSLLEAAVIQWNWLEDLGPTLGAKPDQFNSIHERLIAKWKDIGPYLSQPVYFAGTDEPEDVLTLAYLRDTAEQASLRTVPIAMLDIGWNPDRNAFLDLQERPIQSIFKLYPWESMMAEAVRAARPSHLPRHALDRADLEDAALQQRPPPDPLAAVPQPP